MNVVGEVEVTCTTEEPNVSVYISANGGGATFSCSGSGETKKLGGSKWTADRDRLTSKSIYVYVNNLTDKGNVVSSNNIYIGDASSIGEARTSTYGHVSAYDNGYGCYISNGSESFDVLWHE